MSDFETAFRDLEILRLNICVCFAIIDFVLVFVFDLIYPIFVYVV